MKSSRLLLLSAFVVLVPVSVWAEDPPSAVGPVMKLFLSGRLPAARQATVVEMICSRGNEHDLRVVLDRVVLNSETPLELRLKAMAGLSEASETRKVKPTGELAALVKLVNSPETKLQGAAIRLAADWKVAALDKELQTLALDKKSTDELRHEAIDGLIALGGPLAEKTLRELAGDAWPLPVRMRAVSGLVGFDEKVAAELAGTILEGAKPEDSTGEMLDAFFNRKNGSDQLAAALKTKKLSVDVAKSALRYMYSVGRSDGALSTMLSEAAGVASDPPPPTPEEVAQIVSEVTAKGDPTRGEKIFRRNDVSCMRCHSISGAGGQVGPDLSALGGSSPVDYVVNSILNPNLAIKEQYATKAFVLVDGRVLTGITIDRDETKVRIRDAQGKTIVIPTADIDEEVEGKSLMPQGLTKFMTKQEVLDLARFVSELGKPGPYGIRTVPTIQRWKQLAKPARELIDDVPHLEHIRQYILGSQPGEWLSVYGMVGGTFPLAELRKGKTPVTVIVQGEVQVNEAGKLTVHTDCSETAQGWMDAEAFDPKQDFEMNLEPGKHTITYRVEISDRDSPELRVELRKPDGSAIQFQAIGGM